jgi:hypothetical protein
MFVCAKLQMFFSFLFSLVKCSVRCFAFSVELHVVPVCFGEYLGDDTLYAWAVKLNLLVF